LLYASTGVRAKGEAPATSHYSFSLLSGRKLVVVALKIVSEELTMAVEERVERDEFRRRLKEEWRLLWSERFDDKVRAEGVAARAYPLVFTDRGHVIFATREAKAPSFSDVVERWRTQGKVYSPEPGVGGWGKFMRTELKKVAHTRARAAAQSEPSHGDGQQSKKGGRGWLHK
jgi:hypothetical protein